MRHTTILLALALTAAACGGDAAHETTAAPETTVSPETTVASATTTTAAPTTAVPTTAAPTTAVPTTAAPTTTVPPCDSSWTTGPVTTSGWPGSSGTYSGTTLQTEVRIGAHPGFDRFVIEFEASGAPPGGWSVYWLTGIPVHDGSGMPVVVGGNEFLQVVLLGSAGWAILDPADWYSGPDEFFGVDVGTGNLVEAESAGDFEGYVSWAIGFDHQAEFNVFALTGPPRLVVDVCL